METTFNVIKKNRKPFLRMTCGDYQTDMMVYAAKTDAPYVKHISGLVGKTYLDEELKKALNEMEG